MTADVKLLGVLHSQRFLPEISSKLAGLKNGEKMAMETSPSQNRVFEKVYSQKPQDRMSTFRALYEKRARNALDTIKESNALSKHRKQEIIEEFLSRSLPQGLFFYGLFEMAKDKGAKIIPLRSEYEASSTVRTYLSGLIKGQEPSEWSLKFAYLNRLSEEKAAGIIAKELPDFVIMGASHIPRIEPLLNKAKVSHSRFYQFEIPETQAQAQRLRQMDEIDKLRAARVKRKATRIIRPK